MKIVNWTYCGCFPCGIKLHKSNMRWATGSDVRVLAHPKIVREHKGTTYSAISEPMATTKRGLYFDYWSKFAHDIQSLEGKPDYFLFSELDIYFTKKIDTSLLDGKSIVSHLPILWDYFCVLEGKCKVYPRIWEGAMLIPAKYIYEALEAGVSFNTDHTFWTEEKQQEYKANGRDIRLMTYLGKKTDTMTDFQVYCYLKQIPVIQNLSAIHVRGPERLHGDVPKMYRNVTNDLIKKFQGYVGIEVFDALCLYYISGNPHPVMTWDWRLAKQSPLPWLLELSKTAPEWMNPLSLARLRHLIKLITQYIGSPSLG